jgi:phenylpropionate dioxygenase-like ring-hydroxylating dioxygenase large terminal subunit
MAARNSTSENHGWVDVQRGLVSRDVFVSDEIFRVEMERIFDRTWVYLAHETEIPAAGDFVARIRATSVTLFVRITAGPMSGPAGS